MEYGGPPVMKEEGVVRQVRGNMAVVATLQTEACHSCGAKGACSTMGGLKERIVSAENQLGAKPGDKVVIAVPTKGVLSAGFLVYIAPILALIIGAYLGQRYAGTHGSVILGLLFLAGGWMLARPMGQRLANRRHLSVKVIRILGQAAKPEEACCT